MPLYSRQPHTNAVRAWRRPYSDELETIEDYIVECFAFGTTVAAISEHHCTA